MSYRTKHGYKNKKVDFENLNKEKIKIIESMASVNELNIFYDRNKIIVALCSKLLEIWPDEK